MKKLTSTLKDLWKDESGQGTAEYILLLVAIVGVAFLFKDKLMATVRGQIDAVSGQISDFGSQGGGN